MAQVGDIYLNFGFWAAAIIPAWLVIKEIGVSLGDKKLEREAALVETADSETAVDSKA